MDIKLTDNSNWEHNPNIHLECSNKHGDELDFYIDNNKHIEIEASLRGMDGDITRTFFIPIDKIEEALKLLNKGEKE